MLGFIKKKKYILLAIIFLLIGGSVYAYTNSEKPVEIEHKFAKSTKGNVSVSINVDGKSVIEKRDLSFEISGLIRGVNVKEGDIVKAWQTLAYIDTREARKILENELRSYSLQRNDFEEMIQVTNPGVPLTDTIKRILEKNQWNLEKAVLDVELKDLSVKKAYLSSPIAGQVVAVNIKPGELSATSKVALTVIDETTVAFESYVEDIEALKIKNDMSVRITFDALPDDFVNGHVAFVSPIATIDENDLSMYKVLINFEDTNLTLLDGMAGEVEIISKEVTNIIKIPNSTVKREDGKSVVYIGNNEQINKKEVTLGFTNGKEVEVKSGLSVGDSIVDWK